MAETERQTNARQKIAGLRERITEAVFQGTGIESRERGEYSVRMLSGLKPVDGNTSRGDLNTIGLVGVDGLINIPMIVAAQKGLEDKIDRLAVKFEGSAGDIGDVMGLSLWIAPTEKFGDDVEIGDFYLYPDRRAEEVDWYITGDMRNQGVALAKSGEIVGGLGLKMEHWQSAKGAGRTANKISCISLSKETGNLFDLKTGWLKTEKEIELLIRSWARQVDLKNLSYAESEKFEAVLGRFYNNPEEIQDWLTQEFRLVRDIYKSLKLEGDIEVEAIQIEDPEQPDLNGTIIRIRNIMLPKPDSEVVWSNLVRPKADSLTGTLKIIIYSDGSFSGKVAIDGVEQKGYDTTNLLTTENLAAILAKIT